MSEDTFEPLGWTDDRMPSVLGGRNIASPDFGESETISPVDQMKLGHLPKGGESIDISELLTDGMRHAHDPTAERPLDVGHDRTDSVPLAGDTGWRVRDARGVVYEFETLDELRGHLDGVADRKEIRVAQGIGPFRPVDAFETLESDGQVGALDESDIRSKFVDDSAFITAQSMDGHPSNFGDDDGSLEPDYQRAQRGRREHLKPPLTSSAAHHQTQVSEAVMSTGASMGHPAIMLCIVLIFGAGILIGQVEERPSQGAERHTHSESGQMPIERGESDQRLQEAKDALAAGKAERAVGLLNALIRQDPDCRDAFLNLALALHQTNREKEAKKALETYRALKRK